MARLIDADVIPYEEYYVPDPDSNAQWDFKKELSVLKPVIDQMPTVDAVPVIRCKDCKHYDNSEGVQWCHLNSKFYPGGADWHSFPEDGFCSYGERKDND